MLYVDLHNHGLVLAHDGQEKTMWIVELNVAGYQVTRSFPTLFRPRRSLRARPRNLHRRMPQLGHSPAA
jgi:hypothetical protein